MAAAFSWYNCSVGFLKNINEFKRGLLVYSVEILCVVLIFGGGIIALRSQIASAISRITVAKADRSIKNLQVLALAKLRREHTEAAIAENIVRARLPSRDSLFSFPTSVKALAKNMNVQIEFVFGGEIAGGDDMLSSVAFTMTVTGSLSNLLVFLSEFESRLYMLAVDSIDFVPGKMTLGGRVFFK